MATVSWIAIELLLLDDEHSLCVCVFCCFIFGWVGGGGGVQVCLIVTQMFMWFSCVYYAHTQKQKQKKNMLNGLIKTII